ncbi:hypothetical protein AB0C59_16360 [Streptomyces sp. NPDC048664]|uniref:hypothetical protein n=1 Tax=Streptomyces sp. NPDC048664 TaxID=3154505 RepID=UPI0034403614
MEENHESDEESCRLPVRESSDETSPFLHLPDVPPPARESSVEVGGEVAGLGVPPVRTGVLRITSRA